MSELAVIVKAKDLAEYIFQVSEKSPKKFRMTLTARIENLSLDIIDKLLRANNERIGANKSDHDIRKKYQQEAKSDLDILCSIAEIAKRQQCIQSKHYYQICIKCAEIRKLLEVWIKSDEQRIEKLKEH